MEEFKIIPCRICLNVITHENYRVIEETVKNALEVLLLNLDVEEDNMNAICSSCYIKLFAAYEFKATCLDKERIVYAFVTSAGVVAPVDLKEIYLKERDKECSKIVPEGHRICRLCVQTVPSEFVSLEDMERDLLKKYIPEINFSFTREPVICEPCLHCLHTHSDFLKHCWGMNDREDSPYHIKTEKIEVKFERTDEDSEMPILDNEPAEPNSQDPLETQMHEIEYKDGSLANKSWSEALMYKPDTCDTENKCKDEKSNHPEDKNESKHDTTQQPRHKNTPNLRTYHCDKCQFTTKYKASVARHIQLQHSTGSDVEVYKCTMCNFETKHDKNLVSHRLIHKDTAEVQMYDCTQCNFRTKRKKSLVRHQIVHKETSELQIYKCAHCDFATKHKGSLRSHALSHESDVDMYACDQCDFKTKHKRNLTGHRAHHDENAVAQTYNCDKCDFTTKHKTNILRHGLVHDSLPLAKLYKCGRCDFTTKHKGSLVGHKLVHKDSWEGPMYKCDSCGFETVHKRNLLRHCLKHTSISEPRIFNCEVCTFSTKYGKVLVRHRVKHESTSDSSEVHKEHAEGEMHECSSHSFTSEHQASFAKHKASHGDGFEKGEVAVELDES